MRIGRQHLRDGVLYIRQSKTGTEVSISLHPMLRAALDVLSQKNMTFLLTKDGKPSAVAGFGNWFRDCVAEMKDVNSKRLLFDGLSAHRLRAADHAAVQAQEPQER